MTYTETPDVNYNTRYNNNIAWRNMNIVDLKLNWKDYVDVIIRNPLRDIKPQRLVFREPREQWQDPFIRHANLTVDLGPELMKRWLEAGGKGGGFERVGETQFRVIDPAGAWFDGLMLEPDVAFPMQLYFEALATTTVEKPYIVEAVQLDPQQREPLGGVTYQVYLPTQAVK
jgi:hypothetical protein